MFREELYRAVWNRTFLLSLMIGLALLVPKLPEYCINFDRGANFHPYNCNPYDALLYVHSGFFGLLAPLIATLPFGDSMVLDRAQGYLRNILLRTTFRRYFAAKFFVNLLAGGLAVAIPVLLVFIYANLIYPRGILPIDQARMTPGGYPNGPFKELYRSAPDLYALFRIGLAFLFGAIYANVGLLISLLVNNRYVVLATPFLLAMVGNFVLANLDLARWTPPTTLNPNMVSTTSALTVFGELGAIFAFCLIGLLLLARKERIHP